MQCTTYNNNIIPQTRYTIRAREGGSATVVTATVRDSERERERGSCQGAGARSQLFIYFFITAFHSNTHTHTTTHAHRLTTSRTHTQAETLAHDAPYDHFIGAAAALVAVGVFAASFFTHKSHSEN